MKTRTRIKLKYINGLKQEPRDLDFCITPTIKFARADKNEMEGLGKAWGLAIEWGHWAVGFGVFTAYLKHGIDNYFKGREKEIYMNVLSLFDGMSCGQIALNNLGFKVENYFASEIKKHAIQCTLDNFPNTKQIGDVTKVKGEELPKIDLLIGGSPCQDFSRANSVRDGLKGMKSMLFYEYIRLLEETKPKYYLLENVIMDDLGYNTISDLLGTEPVRLCGSKVSGALRDRLFWTNIGPEYRDLFGGRKSAIPQPKDRKILLNDVLEYGYSDKKKHTCLNTSCGRDANQRYMLHRYATTGMTTIIYTDESMDTSKGVRYCTQTELEKLHNIPIGYTRNLNKAQAGNLIGDGWTVGIVEHIFSFLNGFEKTEAGRQKK